MKNCQNQKKENLCVPHMWHTIPHLWVKVTIYVVYYTTYVVYYTTNVNSPEIPILFMSMLYFVNLANKDNEMHNTLKGVDVI